MTAGIKANVDGSGAIQVGGTDVIGLSSGGSINIPTTGARITGDFSNATIANRVIFQTSTVNGATNIYAIPNGTGTTSGFTVVNNSDPTNAAIGQLASTSTDIRIQASLTGTGSFLPMTFYTGGSERMRVDTSGNVGIGTSSPGQKLAVSGAGATNAQIYNTTLDAGMNIGVDTVGGNIATTAAVPIKFAPNGVERARIDSSGNLLVGSTTRSNLEKVNVTHDGASQEGIIVVNTNTAAGTHTAIGFRRPSATTVGNITTTLSATAYVTSSDYRLKENVQPMTGALAKVAALKPCTYKWKVDGSDGEGFIAHELQAVCPAAVSGEKDAVNEDGSINPQGIDTSFLVATLTAAIQELKAELDATKAEVALLKGAA